MGNITKKRLKEDTVKLSEIMESNKWHEAAAFATENPHVLTQRMCRTQNRYIMYLGEPFLNRAANSGTLQCVEALVKAGAPLEGRCTQKGRTPLLAALTGAVTSDHAIEIADYLISKGARLDVVDDLGESVVYRSCGDMPVRLTKQFIRAGTPLDNTWHREDYDESDKRQTPSITTLAYRCWTSGSKNRLENLCTIIEAGANVNPAIQEISDHPLAAALQLNEMDLADLMLKHGANLNARAPNGETVMFSRLSKEGAQWLVAKAPDLLDAPDRRGRTPLMAHLQLALSEGGGGASPAADVVKVLVLAGANIDAIDDQGPSLSKSPRSLLAEADFPELQSFMRSLLAAKAANEAIEEMNAGGPSP